MAYCRYCGKSLEGGERFCRSCGREVARPEAAVPPGAAPPGAAPPGPGPHRRRIRKWFWIGIPVVVVVAAVASVLVFVVFDDDGETATTAGVATTLLSTPVASEGGGEIITFATGTPEEAVEQFFAAMERKDLDAIFALLDPRALEGMPTGEALEEAKEAMREDLFDYEAVEFSGIKTSTDMTSDTTATVTITDGIATLTVAGGEKRVEDVTDAEQPVTLDLIKHDGSWYMTSGPFF